MSQAVKLYTMKQPNFNPLSNYIIDKTIGQGTFGKVKLGTHKATGEKVAVKILEKEKIENQGDLLRVQREIHILRKIRHPNIIQLFEIIESEVKIYLIMEYAQGGELFEHIVSRQRLDEREAGRILWQLINSIEYLHQLGIVHRDLKPENILMDSTKQIKVVDFGLSNLYQPNQTLHTPCGSPCYAAPEMVSGKPYHGLKTDLWSCGIILYAMICGCVPFEDPNTKQLYEKIKTQDFSVPKWLSPQSIDLLKNMLQKDPQKRFSIDQIRQHDFIRFSGKQHIPKGINTKEKTFVIDVDEEIIEALFSMGVETEEARTMVRNNKHNCITATYYLLVAKRLRNPRNPAQFSPPKKPSVSVKSVNEIVSVSKVVGSINESQKKQMQNEQLFVSNKKDKLDMEDPSKVSGTGGSSSMERIVKKEIVTPVSEVPTYETNPPRKNSKSTQHIPGQQIRLMMQQPFGQQQVKNKSQEPVREVLRDSQSIGKKTQLPRQTHKPQPNQSALIHLLHKQQAERVQTEANKNKFSSLVGQAQKINTESSSYVRHQTQLKSRASNNQALDIFYNPMTERPSSGLRKGSNTQRDVQKANKATSSLHQKLTNQSWRVNESVANVPTRPSVRNTSAKQRNPVENYRVVTNTFFNNTSMHTRNRTDENTDQQIDRSGQASYVPLTQPSERVHTDFVPQQIPRISLDPLSKFGQPKRFTSKVQQQQQLPKDPRSNTPYKHVKDPTPETRRTEDPMITQRFKYQKY